MTVIPILLLCSLALVAASVVLFVWSARQGDCHEAERMCLLPLEDDATAPSEPQPSSDSDPR
ncbi:MAG: hypothetical protein RL398_2231 [Planctomycetota bacterium]|jgi:nitrogen fixation-related uncharacterized protein